MPGSGSALILEREAGGRQIRNLNVAVAGTNRAGHGPMRSVGTFLSPLALSLFRRSVLDSLGALAAPLDADADAFLAEVQRRHLGKYTVEQEADEFSLEYFSRLGMDPKARIATYLDLVKQRAAEDPDGFVARNGGLDIAACEEMYQNDWTTTDDSGNKVPAVVPIGNLHEPHHGDCYRLFNMSQEIIAHGYTATGSPPTFDQPWEELRASAQAATDAFKWAAAVPGAEDSLQVPQRPEGRRSSTDRTAASANASGARGYTRRTLC